MEHALMSDRIVLDTAGSRFEISLRTSYFRAPEPIAPAVRSAVFRVPWSASLVQLLLRAGVSLDPAVRRDPRAIESLRARLWDALCRGELTAVRIESLSVVAPAPEGAMRAVESVAWDAAPPGEPPAHAPPPDDSIEPEAPPQEPPKHWIEVELVSDDGRPLAGRRYRLELPDGSVREGVFDDKGLLREEGVDPGSCSLTLPTESEDEWLALLEQPAA
jgi:hypothetical protein